MSIIWKRENWRAVLRSNLRAVRRRETVRAVTTTCAGRCRVSVGTLRGPGEHHLKHRLGGVQLRVKSVSRGRRFLGSASSLEGTRWRLFSLYA
jgi:hypothetical protein